MTKYLNMALILALVVAAGVTRHYTPTDTDAQRVASISVNQLPN